MWSLSGNDGAAMGDQGHPGLGGIGNNNSRGTGTAQLASAKDNRAIAGLYTSLQQNTDVPGTPPFATGDWTSTGPGRFHAFALGGYWQPSQASWLPSSR